MFVQLLINTLIVGSGYGLIAMAFRLMYSVSPFFNLTLGTVAAAGAYAVFYLTSSAGLAPWWAVLLALAIQGHLPGAGGLCLSSDAPAGSLGR